MRKRVARKVLFGSEGYAVVHRDATIDRAHRRLRTEWRRLRASEAFEDAVAYLLAKGRRVLGSPPTGDL